GGWGWGPPRTQPRLEGGAGRGGRGARQQHAPVAQLRRKQLGVVALLDAQALAAMSDEQLRRLDEPLFSRSGDLRNRRVRRAGVKRQLDERLRDGPRGNELRPHLGDEARSAVPTPIDELGDELVELRGAENPNRDRP